MTIDCQSRFHFIANNVALDFINTCYGVDDHHEECLTTDDSVVTWLRLAGLLPASFSTVPKGLLERAVALRQNASDVLQAVLSNRPSDPKLINDILVNGRPYQQLRWQAHDQEFVEVEIQENHDADSLLYPIVDAFVKLLCGAQLQYVRQCEADNCVLVFVDTTKSHRRRWCSMALCGNRAKVAAHRKKQADANATS
ncbi:CGNR zinc finger domain-containing protein [Marinomonas posidonica]|uniref:CGNR zinc finger domain-containing protein n=1 Tax=Marinomonas posidonica TaxID=936476 RepID=UPI003736253F